jgi:hypothetical protein
MIQVEGKSVEELEDLNARMLIGVQDIPEYSVWKAMKKRCYNPNTAYYHNWGGRGIKVCEEWKHNFWSWFHYIGRRPNASLTQDRIDNDGDYRPGNVRWTTRWVQAHNLREDRPQRKLTPEDVEQIRALRGYVPIPVIADDYGVSVSNIQGIQSGRRRTDGKDMLLPLGKARNGSINGLAIIDEDDALYIKMLLAEGQLTNWEIAEEAGTTRQTVSHIKHGRTWTHVHLPDNWRELLAARTKTNVPANFVRRV